MALVFMAALWNKAGHYIFALWFLLSSSVFTVKRKCVDSKFWVETQLPPVFERRNTCDWY